MTTPLEKEALHTYIYNSKLGGFPPFSYLKDLSDKEIFFSLPIIFVCYILFKNIDVRFSAVIGILVGFFLFFAIINKKRIEKNTHNDDIEQKTKSMSAYNLKHLQKNPELFKFFIKYNSFYKKNKHAFDKTLKQSNYFCQLIDKVKSKSQYHVGKHIEDLKILKNLILNNFSSIVVGMPSYSGFYKDDDEPNVVDNELVEATNELQQILYSQIYYCMKFYEKNENKIINYPEYVPSSLFYGPTGNDTKTKRYSVHYSLY
tara:strand:- start:865 stop:1641 length:777 start_codon:yes stop_codon:yes gene_type:complete